MRPDIKLQDARILIVDDEPDLRDIFSEWLKGSGCASPRTAADGAAAVAAIQAERVDLLITDVRMPIMDGVTLVRRLYELKLEVPSIVFVSGFGDVDMRHMYDLGVEAFLAKPLKREELIGCAERAIADRSELWLNPMSPPPRQSMHVEAAGVVDALGGVRPDLNCLSFGRGGFRTQATAPLGLGPVAFSCRLPSNSLQDTANRVLAGHGLVRWFSRTDQTVGIEFAYLDPSCRTWVLDQIAASAPRSFIPCPWEIPADPAH